jgi:hypothetical protein
MNRAESGSVERIMAAREGRGLQTTSKKNGTGKESRKNGAEVIDYDGRVRIQVRDVCANNILKAGSESEKSEKEAEKEVKRKGELQSDCHIYDCSKDVDGAMDHWMSVSWEELGVDEVRKRIVR